MKKFLLSLALVAMCTTTVSAQLIQRNPVAQPLTPRAAKAPVQKTLGPNQLYMGPYVSDALADYGLGLTGYSGVFKQGTVLPIDMVRGFEGGEVKAIRFGLSCPVTDGGVFIYPVTSLSPLTLGEPLAEQLVETTVTGWNQVELDNPFVISTEGIVGLMIGYQYMQKKGNTNDCYPISVVEEGTILASYTYAEGVTNGWEDIGLSTYGNLSVQAIVENENFPPYNLQMGNLAAYPYAKISEGLPFSVKLSNYGIAESLNDYTIDVMVDGEVKTTINSPIAVNMAGSQYAGVCPLDGVTTGQHTLGLRVNTVAGEAVTDAATVEATFAAYNTAFPRQKNLVEQFTSTTCTWCPLGVTMLKKLKEMCGESMEWVGVHVNIPTTGDPFVIAKGTSLAGYLGANSAPTGAFNRFDGEMTGSIIQSLGFYEQYAQMAAEMFKANYFDGNPTPALATINIEPTYDQENNKVAIKVSGQLSEDFATIYGSTMGLTVYLTEDSLVARQLNQGTYVNDYVHNGVVRAIPTAYNGDAITVTGKTEFEKGYVVTMNSAWKPENMRVVALVHRRGAATSLDKQVINCEGVPLLSAAMPGDANGDGQVDIADVNAAIDMMLGKAAVNMVVDMNNDGQVDIADVNALIDLMLGK